MTKKARPSINDQLAKIAAQAPSSVATSPRDAAVTSQRDSGITLQRDNAETDQRGNVGFDEGADRAAASTKAALPEEEGPAGYKRRVRYEKPHASIYAHPKVFKALREIAVAQDCKPHDLFLEGLRQVLRQHGRDFDALNRGE